MGTDEARSAIVIGAGIAGLAAAIALRNVGYQVRGLERAPALEAAGAALSLWPNAIAALDALGVGHRVRAESAQIETMGVFDQRGQAILRPYALRRAALLPTRSLLQSTLVDGVGRDNLSLGMSAIAIDQGDVDVIVTCADGSRHRAQLAIVADGIWSRLATEIIGTVATHRGYGGVIALSTAIADDRARGRAAEYWGQGQRFGVLDAGQGRRYWFYMQNEAGLAAPASISRDRLRALAADWPHPVGQVIEATGDDRMIPFSIHAKPPPRRLGRGRIICVGDAAHAMEPNLGQGGCQGLEDAVALGVAAQYRPAEGILPLFEEMRLRRIALYVARSAAGGEAVHSRSALRRGITNTALRMMPGAISGYMINTLHKLPSYAAMAA